MTCMSTLATNMTRKHKEQREREAQQKGKDKEEEEMKGRKKKKRGTGASTVSKNKHFVFVGSDTHSTEVTMEDAFSLLSTLVATYKKIKDAASVRKSSRGVYEMVMAEVMKATKSEIDGFLGATVNMDDIKVLFFGNDGTNHLLLPYGCRIPSYMEYVVA